MIIKQGLYDEMWKTKPHWASKIIYDNLGRFFKYKEDVENGRELHVGQPLTNTYRWNGTSPYIEDVIVDTAVDTQGSNDWDKLKEDFDNSKFMRMWSLRPSWATGLIQGKITNNFAYIEGLFKGSKLQYVGTKRITRLTVLDAHTVIIPPKPLPTTSEVLESPTTKAEDSGGSCDYYRVPISTPTTPAQIPYTAECNDVIEGLGMTYAEANIFKELWRTAAARTLGKHKANHDSIRGADKIVFFAGRNRIQKVAEHAAQQS